MATDALSAPDGVIQGKNCTKCGEWKPLSAYSKASNQGSGFRPRCKACSSADQKAYFAANPGRAAEIRARRKERAPLAGAASTAKYRASNADRVREDQRAYREKNREAMRARDRARYAANREREIAADAAYRLANADKLKKQRAARRAANLEQARAVGRETSRLRRATPRGKLENSIRVGFWRGLTKGSKAGRSTFELLGYTLEDLMSHLEQRFEVGMTWDNYGQAWHVDHVIPLAVHNYETPYDIDFHRAWALSNLQPLWGAENKSKGAKIIAPFQPSLALAA